MIKKKEIKLCISVNIYHSLPKLGMSTHAIISKLAYFQNLYEYSCFQNYLWEIKLCISVNIYRRLPKLGMSTHIFKIMLSICYHLS